MVGEFPELQGIMGEIYALKQGETPEVAQAIREHYMPTSADGELPSSVPGALLAVADKLDHILKLYCCGYASNWFKRPLCTTSSSNGASTNT